MRRGPCAPIGGGIAMSVSPGLIIAFLVFVGVMLAWAGSDNARKAAHEKEQARLREENAYLRGKRDAQQGK